MLIVLTLVLLAFVLTCADALYDTDPEPLPGDRGPTQQPNSPASGPVPAPTPPDLTPTP